MTIRQLLVISISTLLLLTLPCKAGPCSENIELVQARIDAKLNALAAAGPSASESPGAKMHRQPTPHSIVEAEIKLGEVSPSIVEKVKEAIARARTADIAGDKSACEQALADIQRMIGP